MKIVFFGNTVHSLIGAKIIQKELGFSLGTLVNALLKQFVRNREVNISSEYRPTPELIASIREARWGDYPLMRSAARNLWTAGEWICSGSGR